MKRYYVDEVPRELRPDFFGPTTYSIYDSEKDELAAFLDIIQRGATYAIRTGNNTLTYPALRNALDSISRPGELDIPDDLFEILQEELVPS